MVAERTAPRTRSAPAWAREMRDKMYETLERIEEKVDFIMALDMDVIHRIMVGAQFLADREKANQQKIADLTQKLADAGAAEAAEDAAEAQANTAAAAVADSIDALVASDQTPTVQVPADPGTVASTVGGQTPVVVTDPGPAPADPGTPAPAPSDPGTPAPAPSDPGTPAPTADPSAPAPTSDPAGNPPAPSTGGSVDAGGSVTADPAAPPSADPSAPAARRSHHRK